MRWIRTFGQGTKLFQLVRETGFYGEITTQALRSEQLLTELAAKHAIHQTMITAWKRQAIEAFATTLSGRDYQMTLRKAGKGYVLEVSSAHQFWSWIDKPPIAGTAQEIAKDLADPNPK